MNPDQYRALIRHTIDSTLAKNGKYPTRAAFVAALTDKLVDNMELADAMSASGGLLVESAAPAIVQDSVIVPAQTVQHGLASVDISNRVGVPQEPRQYLDGEVEALRAGVVQNLKATLPPTFQVTPDGFTSPLTIHLSSISSASGSMPIVSIIYAPAGAPSEQYYLRYSINVLQVIPTPADILKELTTQAKNLYSSRPRAVQTKMPIPMRLVDGENPDALQATTDDDPNSLAASVADAARLPAGPSGFRTAFGSNLDDS